MSESSSPPHTIISSQEDNDQNIYETVFAEFEWDNCNIIRIPAGNVDNIYPEAIDKLLWKNLSAEIKATLPYLHTLDLATLTPIDVVALYAFIATVSTAIIECKPLKDRYKISNNILCEGLKKNIERFHDQDDGQPTEAESICESYTEQLGQKHRRIYTAEERAQIQIADALNEERMHANAAARRRQQHEKKLLVITNTRRGAVKGLMRVAEKDNNDSMELNTRFQMNRGAGTTSNALIDKFAPTKILEAPKIDNNRIIAGASSLCLTDLIKKIDTEAKLTGKSGMTGTIVRGKRGLEYTFSRQQQYSGGSIFSPENQSPDIKSGNRWQNAAMNAINNGHKSSANGNRENRDNGDYNNESRREINISEPIKWDRGSTSSTDPTSSSSSSNSKGGWASRGSANDDKILNNKRDDSTKGGGVSSSSLSSWSARGSANRDEVIVSSPKSPQISYERGSNNSNNKTSSKHSPVIAAWPHKKIAPHVPSVEAVTGAAHTNRWSALNNNQDNDIAENGSDVE